jgi:hypothetical protein
LIKNWHSSDNTTVRAVDAEGALIPKQSIVKRVIVAVLSGRVREGFVAYSKSVAHFGEMVKKSLLNLQLEDTLLPAKNHDVLALDEVWSFVMRRSNKRWLWIALCGRTLQVLAYVMGGS